jgi:hypothetical protein
MEFFFIMPFLRWFGWLRWPSNAHCWTRLHTPQSAFQLVKRETSVVPSSLLAFCAHGRHSVHTCKPSDKIFPYYVSSANSASNVLSRWFLAQFILRPWRWRRYVPPKCRLTFNELHDIISQKTVLFITTAVWTSNPTLLFLFVQQPYDHHGCC